MIQTTAVPAPAASSGADSVFDWVVAGGPMMIPIGICSVVALTYVIERAIRLRESELGSRRYGERLIEAFWTGGTPRALELLKQEEKPLGRVLVAAMRRVGAPRAEVEKAIEDAGAREVKRLSGHVRPLAVIGVLAPLLGLLGTVCGIIIALSQIAHHQALGRPEMLAAGIYQSLITTAGGLCVAIPAQAAYFWYTARIDRFVHRCETCYDDLEQRIERGPAPEVAPARIEVQATGGVA